MATTTAEAPPSPPSRTRSRVRPSAGFYTLLLALGGVVAAGFGWLYSDQALALLGIPDPGWTTTLGLPFVRAAGEICAVIAIGNLLLAAFGVPPREDGKLDVDGFRATRIAAWAGLGWMIAALLLVPLSLSEVSGMPLSQTIQPEYWSIAYDQVAIAAAFFWTAVFAAIFTLGAFATNAWIWTPVLTAVSFLSIMPLAVQGHSASGGSHDIATNSFIWHLVFTAAWVGGLCAVVAHIRRRGTHMVTLMRRYSFVAAIAFVVMVLTGLINAGSRVSWSDWIGTEYGTMLWLKTGLLIALGLMGYLHRKRTLPLIAKDETKTGPLYRLAAVEVIVMALTMGVAVALGRTPPPAPDNPNLSIQAVELGYDLPGPPTILKMFTLWRLDLFLGVISIVIAGLYIWGVVVARKKGMDWPINRTLFWLAGCVQLLWTTSSGLGMYAPAMFSLHMVSHMLLSMSIPVCLALGGPITLALRVMPAAGRGKPPGIREWIVVFINNPVSRFLTNPIVAAGQFVAGFWVLYFSPLYDVMVSDHAGHLFMMVHFLISGYIFYWVVIGVDAAPKHTSPWIRFATVTGALPFHAFFGIALMQSNNILGREWYETLNLPWVTNLLTDQNSGGGVAWGAGEIPFLLVFLALATQWLKEDRKEAARADRQAERDDDAELKAYNAMLQQMSTGEQMADEEYYTADYDQSVKAVTRPKKKHSRY